MLKKVGIWVLVLGLSFAFFAGCAMVRHKKSYSDYEVLLQTLKERGGEEKAPYETAKAEGYLKAMKSEIDENDPKGAALFSEKVDQYLQQGLKKVQ